jgi:hypothetical protein
VKALLFLLIVTILFPAATLHIYIESHDSFSLNTSTKTGTGQTERKDMKYEQKRISNGHNNSVHILSTNTGTE